MSDIIAYTLIILIGLLLLIKPEISWKITHHWDTVGGEPSDMYLRYCRIIGGLAVTVSITAIIVFVRNSIVATIWCESFRLNS